ncbi:putative oxidoreductase [Umezawaea tangerina]|uniref:Putative oxidoreductase n=2 Tax=Umezawaea tangerina TaxID=84725 RepID=A0A2T0T7D6_9PSEU|nr:putative oxidoreductase [Umezawaea tangerina]
METVKTVLITGGSRGIGLGLARRYLDSGARVLVTGRSTASLAQAAARGVETVVSDIGDAASREALAKHVSAVMPEVDLVINNAGVQRRVVLASDDAPWEEREAEIRVLLSGPVHLNHLLIPTLLAHGRPATIVNVTSGGAYVPQPFAPLYSAAKAALHSYTTNLRFALAHTAVRVVELVPPAVATGLAGLDNPHGAPVDDFVDVAYAGINRGDREVGYGPTATAEFTQRLQREHQVFTAQAGRFPVASYAAEVA